MSEILNKARAKIASELADEDVKLGRAEKKLLPHIAKTLEFFCEQSEAFSERFVACKETIATCTKETFDAMDDKEAPSDFEVYNAAVKFYFPECEVMFEMKLIDPSDQETAAVTIDINDFFEF